MDKEFLKKYKLQEAVKRFQQINEYTFITSPVLAEDDEEDNNNQQPQNDDMNNGNPPMQDQSQGVDMGGNDNQQMPPPQEGDNGMNNAPDMQSGDGSMQAQPMPQPEQMSDVEGEEDVDSGETDEEGDTVIDVDDLTDSQEATEYKIDGVDDKLTRMLSVLSKFSAALEASDKKIDDLRQEFERRNPSEQEKLNIRSQASYPYSETPKDYWDNKTATNPHYNIMYDNDVSTADEQEKFDITKDDIKNINFKNIADSFDIEDMKLDDFVKF